MAACGSDQVDVPAELRRLRRELGTLRRALERDEERADGILQNLSELEGRVVAGFNVGSAFSAAGPRVPSARPATYTLQLAAQVGVSALELKPLANGAALARIDGGAEFELSPALAGLLAILAEDVGSSDDALVGWKSVIEVTERLRRRLGRSCSRHAINQLVLRLRAVLAERGALNPFLVQTDRRFGLRFALHRRRL